MDAPPPLTQEMRLVLDRLAVEDADLGDPTLLSPSLGRALAAEANRRWNVDLPDMAEIEDFEIVGPDGNRIPVRLLVPGDASPGLTLFIHGGGWAFCSIATHERAARLLAVESGRAVMVFDYRLAPEHPFPAGLTDCIAVWRAAADGPPTGAFTPGPVAIAGDSAGANLALATMINERRAGRPLPDCGLLFYGVYDADFATLSYRQYADGPGLSGGKMRRYWDWYAPNEGSRTDPLVAPLRANDADLAALPPLYLNAAEIDPLRSDSEALHTRLAGLGRSDTLRIHQGVVHGFMQMTVSLQEARTATAEAGTAFRQMTDSITANQETTGGDLRCAI